MQEQTLNAAEKELQIDIVFNILQSSAEPLRTDQVKIAALKKGVSCADKYLRLLTATNKVARFWELKPGTKEKKNRTKHWSTKKYFEENIKPKLNTNYAL